MTSKKWLSGFTASIFGMGGIAIDAYAENKSFEFSAEAVFSGAAASENGTSFSQPFTGEIGVGVEKEHYFDNGVAVGFVAEIRAQGDNRKRQTFAGELQFDAANPAFSENLNDLLPALRSPATGLVAASSTSESGAYATFEQGFAYLKAGWGEVSLGRDIGAAARLDARAPSVLKYSSPNSSRLNPIAFSSVRARNDVTGPSAKVTYMSPRIVGFRVGASFTPEANARGIDFDASRLENDIVNANLESVTEGGLSFSHLFRDSDLRVRLGVTGIRASSNSIDNRFGNYEALGAGIELEKGFWKLGAQYLDSNNAIEDGSGDYQAWEVGLSRNLGKWTVTGEYGHALDRLQFIKGENRSMGVSKRINDYMEFGAAYISSESKQFGTKIQGSGAVLELIVRYE